ncbi:MAG: recombination-associated protein RdgC [Burkholderiales bacterium]|nr:recombination-associated protein RdgC [Burkholderiales bacterium]
MFKNVMLYRIAAGWPSSAATLERALQDARFVECGAHQEKSVGWIEPRGQEHGALVEVVARQWIMKLMIEVKVLPASVVRRKVDEQVEQIEASTGRKPGKKERRTLNEDVRLALLPLAFTKQASVMVWVDPVSGFLVTDAGSQAKADEVMTWLIKAVDGLVVQLVQTQQSAAGTMAAWLAAKEGPRDFSVDRECELKAADESRAVVRYTRHALDTDEVSQHITMGKMPTRLALTWGSRVSFVLTEQLQLKKVAFLETVFEGSPGASGDTEDDAFDADVAIATGELRKLLPDLLEALGGEALPA